MNTEESDRAQVEYARAWWMRKARKKMDKLEKQLEKWARVYFGEPVVVIYARDGAVIVAKDGTESEIRINEGEKNV